MFNGLVVDISCRADDLWLSRALDLNADIFPTQCRGSHRFTRRFFGSKPPTEPFYERIRVDTALFMLRLPLRVSMRKISNLEGMKYSLGERNEVAAFSLTDESAYARKIDEISPDAQVAGESDTAHLVIEWFIRGWLEVLGENAPEGKLPSFYRAWHFLQLAS